MKKLLQTGTITIIALAYSLNSFAQADNEIQVYSSPTVEQHTTMVELHSNYTFRGSDYLPDPEMAHYLNESVEITHGFTPHFEMGVYFFTTLGPDGKYEYLGSHIRPRVTVPDEWHWPLGASLSMEFGFFRQGTGNPYRWEGEIRPILDRTYGNFYISFNPNVAFVLTGEDKYWGIEPQLKTVYTIHKVGVGFEYYSDLGTFRKISPIKEEGHLLGPAVDLYLSPKWEINGGFLFGLTPNSNRQILKIVLGRHVGKMKK